MAWKKLGSIRSIPAPTGEPRQPVVDPRGVQPGVYPRAYGGTGYLFHSLMNSCVDGSIPAPTGEPIAIRRILISMLYGLSPRLRGNLRRACQQGSVGSAVYPRAYGGTERGHASRDLARKFGLSPRLRGNLSYARLQ